MQTTVRRLSLPDHRRILMLSDPHGHADGLRAILKEAGFSGDDVLILLGDYLEKGPQSLETLRLVMELQRTRAVYPLMGNVELWRLEMLESGDEAAQREMQAYSLKAKAWWGGSLLHEMCAELGCPLTEDTDICALFPEIRRHFAPEIAFLHSLPTILETQRFIFVHGGVPHEDLAALEGTDAFPLLKFDDFYSAGLSFRKTVVVGHWPTVLYSPMNPVFDPIVDRERHIICLDGACGVKSEGQLNLLILPEWKSDDYSFLTWDALPRITALDFQAASPKEKARYIRWNDHAVTLLDRGEEMSRVLYKGAPMDVPTRFLFDHDGVLSCSDVTDYRLPVEPGDEMHLILALKRGCYVKKDGAAGWYFGRWAAETKEG